MNARHHGDLTLIACHLAGVPEAQREPLIQGAEGADFLEDVLCSVPFEGEQPCLLGKDLTSLQHFQRSDDSGYYWHADRSLGGLEELGDIAMHLARTEVTGTTPPMVRACEVRPRAPLSDLVFPSAGQVGSYWSTFPAGCDHAGTALHLVQDACVPHHVWGVLRWGHQEWEDACEGLWFQHREMVQGNAESMARVASAVRAELAGISTTTVEGLIKANAAWTFRWFGPGRHLDVCPISECLASCVRAVASSMRAIAIMGGHIETSA